MLGLSAFWATVVKVELTDIVFAIDSILVAVAMSPKLWVILTGGILGIVMMRLVIGKLLALVERYPPLVDGAFVIIAWVGIKLLVEFLHAEHYIALRDPAVAVARADRGDLRRRLALRAARRSAGAAPSRTRGAAELLHDDGGPREAAAAATCLELGCAGRAAWRC